MYEAVLFCREAKARPLADTGGGRMGGRIPGGPVSCQIWKRNRNFQRILTVRFPNCIYLEKWKPFSNHPFLNTTERLPFLRSL